MPYTITLLYYNLSFSNCNTIYIYCRTFGEISVRTHPFQNLFPLWDHNILYSIYFTGNLPIESLQYTITGVAIADTTEALSMYFGCYADLQATGGVGLVRISRHGLDKQIYPIKSGSHRVYGGYLFLSDTVDVSCDYSTSSSHGQDKTSSETPAYTIGSIPAVSSPQGGESLPNISLASQIHMGTTVLMAFTALNILL